MLNRSFDSGNNTFLHFNPSIPTESTDVSIPFSEFEEHHDALFPILSEIQPNAKRILVHFDSHPDLSVCDNDENFLQEFVDGNVNITKLHKLATISSWIAPLVHANYFDEVYWVAGYWTHQIQSGTYKMQIGFDRHGNQKVNSVERGPHVTYWSVDGQISHDLTLNKTWTLHSVSMNQNGKFSEIPIQSTNSSWMLDVDQDFFCTNNPFRHEFEKKYGSYAAGKLEDFSNTAKDYLWNSEINVVKSSFLDILFALSWSAWISLIPKTIWLLILGVPIDEMMNKENSLPHHCVQSEIDFYMKRVEKILTDFATSPELITTSKSRGSGYTPNHQQEKISRDLKEILERVYKLHEIKLSYSTDN